MNTITLAPGLTLIHGDCMEYLATLSDGAVDLAVVDPPYGIGSFHDHKTSSRPYNRDWDINWNDDPPPPDYFRHVVRVSNNRIVWGINYYAGMIEDVGRIVWDKGNNSGVGSSCELASQSLDRRVVKVSIQNIGYVSPDRGDKIHPCQKPVALYRWLLQNYAKPGQTILDTHLGSGSSAIAAWEMGYTFTGIEIDKDYFNAAVERISKRLLSPYLPGIAGNEGKGQAEQVKLFCGL